jgi:hypothetical protein
VLAPISSCPARNYVSEEKKFLEKIRDIIARDIVDCSNEILNAY